MLQNIIEINKNIAEVYLEPSPTSTMELFSEYS